MPEVGGPHHGVGVAKELAALGHLCPVCFSSSQNIAMDGMSQPSSEPPETDIGWATGLWEACVLYKVTERSRGAPSSGASTSIALDVREHTPLT